MGDSTLTLGTFALAFEKFADMVKGNADQVVGDVVVQLAAAIDRRSPVGDRDSWLSLHPRSDIKTKKVTRWEGPAGYSGGRFRGNWQLGVDKRPDDVVDTVDPTGATTQSGIQAAIPDKASGKVYYLINNLPYAQRLEEGWSSQAPTGMVGLTVIEFPQMVEQAVAGLK